MSTNLSLLIVLGMMAACGVYLLMERSLVRMLFGLLLVGNALNLLIVVTSGGMGNPPVMGRSSENRPADADPLAQGMVLTAIVIMMGVAAFVLALVYRLFVINRHDDDVEDDVEDVKILTGSLGTAPDRDRSDDPVTLSDTPTGDYFDDEGNPMTAEEVEARKTAVHETDLMPTETDVIDELGDDDDEGGATNGNAAAERGGHFEELDSDKSDGYGQPPVGPHEHGSRAHGSEEHGPGELGPDEVGPKGSEARPEAEKPEDIPAEEAHAEDEQTGDEQDGDEQAGDEQARRSSEGDDR